EHRARLQMHMAHAIQQRALASVAEMMLDHGRVCAFAKFEAMTQMDAQILAARRGDEHQVQRRLDADTLLDAQQCALDSQRRVQTPETGIVGVPAPTQYVDLTRIIAGKTSRKRMQGNP